MFGQYAGLGLTKSADAEDYPAGWVITADELAATIRQQPGGALYIWASDVNKNVELALVKANPLRFKATAVPGDPGTYIITNSLLGSALPGGVTGKATPKPGGDVIEEKPGGTDLAGYVPYVLLGAGALLVLKLLKN